MGERLGDLLDKKGLNAQRLSDDTGIPKATISEIISDKDKNFGYKTIIKIAEYLNVSVDYLVGMAGLPSKDYDKKFINQYTGLTEKSIEILSNAKKNYDLYDESQYTPEAEEAYMEGEDILLFINSLLEFNEISYTAENFHYACDFQTKEKIDEKYYNYFQFETADSKEEKEIFSKMKSIGWVSKEDDSYYRHEDTETVAFRLFILNGRFKELVEKIGEKNYFKELETYINIK